MTNERQNYKWFVSGDWNGFFGLIFDNLTVLSFLAGILVFVFKYPADIVYTKMFPGTAFGVLFGDLIYTWMAFRLAKKTGNTKVTAMPLGLDTPSTIGITLIVLGPAFIGLKAEGIPERDAALMTWYIGMATMMFMGVIKLFFSFFGKWIQKVVPQAGLLGSLAGIGLGLIGVTPLIDIFGMPMVGLIACCRHQDALENSGCLRFRTYRHSSVLYPRAARLDRRHVCRYSPCRISFWTAASDARFYQGTCPCD